MPKQFFTRMMTACLALALMAPRSTRAFIAVSPFADYPAPDGNYRMHTIHGGDKSPAIAQFQKKTIFGNWKNISQFSLAPSGVGYPSAAAFSSDLQYWITIGGDDLDFFCTGSQTFNKMNPVEVRIYLMPEGKMVKEIKLNDLIPNEEIQFWLENIYGKLVRPIPVAISEEKPVEKSNIEPRPVAKPVITWKAQSTYSGNLRQKRGRNSAQDMVIVKGEPTHVDTTSTTSTTTINLDLFDHRFTLSMDANLTAGRDGTIILETFWGRKISLSPATGQVIKSSKPEFDFQTLNSASAVAIMERRRNFSLWRHMAGWLGANGEAAEIPALEMLFLTREGYLGQDLPDAIAGIDYARYVDFLAQLLASPNPEFRTTAINRLQYAKPLDEARRAAFFKKALRDSDAGVRKQAFRDLLLYLAYAEPQLLPATDRMELLNLLRSGLKEIEMNNSEWWYERNITRIADLESLQTARRLLLKAVIVYEKEKSLQEIDAAIQKLQPPAP